MGSHTDPDDVRTAFVATRLRPSERAELEELAAELDRPMASLIRDAIRVYLRRMAAAAALDEGSNDV